MHVLAQLRHAFDQFVLRSDQPVVLKVIYQVLLSVLA